MMKDLIRLSDIGKNGAEEIFEIADGLERGEYKDTLNGKSAVMFFPASSIRTRISFEKGVYLLSGQSILFPNETLDKKEELRDVAGYLDNWADLIFVRHRSIGVVEELAKYADAPVINVMTDANHPCEILSDIYALKKLGKDIEKSRFLFFGTNGNIGRTWKAAADIFGFELEHCCAKGYELDGLKTHYDLEEAARGKDIICTDALPQSTLPDFSGLCVTPEVMAAANEGAVLNPCPPFYRDEEVSAEVIDSPYFVGYGFKKYLLTVQQAIMIYCILK